MGSTQCALLYFDEDCGGREKEISDSLTREALHRSPKNVVVRPGCKFVGGSIRQGSQKVIVDARVSNSHLWERLEEGAVEYVECYCTGVYPGGRPPASEGIGGGYQPGGGQGGFQPGVQGPAFTSPPPDDQGPAFTRAGPDPR